MEVKQLFVRPFDIATTSRSRPNSAASIAFRRDAIFRRKLAGNLRGSANLEDLFGENSLDDVGIDRYRKIIPQREAGAAQAFIRKIIRV